MYILFDSEVCMYMCVYIYVCVCVCVCVWASLVALGLPRWT